MRTELELECLRACRCGLALLVLGAAVLAGCAKTTEGGSGETHFLMMCDDACPGDLECLCGVCTLPCAEDDACGGLPASCQAASCGDAPRTCERECSADVDCAVLGATHTCEAGHCRAPAAPSKADAGVRDAGGRDADGPHLADAATALNCAEGCEAVPGMRVDEARGCVDDSGPVPEVACVCGGLQPAACRERLADGTAWVLPQDGLDPAEEWGPCSDAQQIASSFSCEFAQCDTPPASVCSMQDFCAGTDCGGLVYDEAGCARADCELDADCGDAERCVAHDCLSSGFCSYSAEGVCQCAGLAFCGYGRICAPVALAGPAGDWVSFRVDEGWGPCMPGEICQNSWVLTSDGMLNSEKAGVSGSATLQDFELEELRRILDGPELRSALEDGIACGPGVTDVGIEMTLELTTGPLQRGVTDCIFSGPEGNIFDRLFQLVQMY